MLVPNKIFLIANWKMNPTTLSLAKKLATSITERSSSCVEIVICPPHIFFTSVQTILGSRVSYGVQDICSDENISLTGEISGQQIVSMGAEYALIGHSSRRGRGEKNSDIAKKVHLCLLYDIIPVVCVGETARDAQNNYLQELETQLRESFMGCTKADFEHIIIAYEPVWAIGADAQRGATPDEFEHSMIFIKKVLNDITGNIPVGTFTIIYGGSVSTPHHINSFIDIGAQGVLLGRASIDSDVFNNLCSTLIQR